MQPLVVENEFGDVVDQQAEQSQTTVAEFCPVFGQQFEFEGEALEACEKFLELRRSACAAGSRWPVPGGHRERRALDELGRHCGFEGVSEEFTQFGEQAGTERQGWLAWFPAGFAARIGAIVRQGSPVFDLPCRCPTSARGFADGWRKVSGFRAPLLVNTCSSDSRLRAMSGPVFGIPLAQQVGYEVRPAEFCDSNPARQ